MERTIYILQCEECGFRWVSKHDYTQCLRCASWKVKEIGRFTPPKELWSLWGTSEKDKGGLDKQ